MLGVPRPMLDLPRAQPTRTMFIRVGYADLRGWLCPCGRPPWVVCWGALVGMCNLGEG
jgi:hypothetical protein